MKNKIHNILANCIGYAIHIPLILLIIVGFTFLAPAIILMELSGIHVDLTITDEEENISNDKIKEES